MSLTRTAPHYQRVADTLKARIVSGTYRPGEHLPVAAELERMFNVSNITIRKSLDMLARDGWVAGKRGVGTIVTQTPAAEMVDIRLSGNFTEWFQTAAAMDYDFEQHVLDVGACRPPERIGQLLGVGSDDPVWRLRRVRTSDQGPISFHVNFADQAIAGAIGHRDLIGSFNFVELLKRHSPRPLVRAEQRVEARVADIDIADLLGAEFGAPIFFAENIYRASDERVIAVTHLYLRGDRYRYSASIDIDQEFESREGTKT